VLSGSRPKNLAQSKPSLLWCHLPIDVHGPPLRAYPTSMSLNGGQCPGRTNTFFPLPFSITGDILCPTLMIFALSRCPFPLPRVTTVCENFPSLGSRHEPRVVDSSTLGSIDSLPLRRSGRQVGPHVRTRRVGLNFVVFRRLRFQPLPTPQRGFLYRNMRPPLSMPGLTAVHCAGLPSRR